MSLRMAVAPPGRRKWWGRPVHNGPLNIPTPAPSVSLIMLEIAGSLADNPAVAGVPPACVLRASHVHHPRQSLPPLRRPPAPRLPNGGAADAGGADAHRPLAPRSRRRDQVARKGRHHDPPGRRPAPDGPDRPQAGRAGGSARGVQADSDEDPGVANWGAL